MTPKHYLLATFTIDSKLFASNYMFTTLNELSALTRAASDVCARTVGANEILEATFGSTKQGLRWLRVISGQKDALATRAN